MTKQIPLTKGYFTTVDDEDYDRLSEFKWHLHCSRGRHYAARSYYASGMQGLELMHRTIAGAPCGVPVDHVDNDGLNNCRSNLRYATQSTNLMNQPKHKNNKSGYKGVRFVRGHWRAEINFRHSRIHIGYFETPEEAARAYNEKARELAGVFARLNPI